MMVFIGVVLGSLRYASLTFSIYILISILSPLAYRLQSLGRRPIDREQRAVVSRVAANEGEREPLHFLAILLPTQPIFCSLFVSTASSFARLAVWVLSSLFFGCYHSLY